jgi:hypothetical protein
MPTTTLLAGIWSVATLNKAWVSKTVHFRIQVLNQALGLFEEFRRQRGNTVNVYDEKVRAVFAVPEYYFTPTDAEGTVDYGDFQAKDLAARIDQPRNVLVIPGSIASRKAVTQERREKYREGIGNLGDLVPERYARRLEMEHKTGFIRNTAYAFLHGQKRLKSRKQRDPTDPTTDEGPYAFIPGWDTNKAVLPVDPDPRTLSFGLEICADASKLGEGRKGYIDLENDNPVQVKILVSAVLEMDNVYSGNYTHCLIHAADRPEHSGVVAGVATKTQHVASRPYLGYQLDFHSITIK